MQLALNKINFQKEHKSNNQNYIETSTYQPDFVMEMAMLFRQPMAEIKYRTGFVQDKLIISQQPGKPNETSSQHSLRIENNFVTRTLVEKLS